MSSGNLPPLKSPSANLSSHTLNEGLTLIGKTLASTLQWTGEFTKIQNQHYQDLKAREKELETLANKPSVSYKEKILKGFSKFTQKVCHLCMQEKPSESFILMCPCQHSFCFSCLNTYAISKIEDIERVACPQNGCQSEMKLTSPVYKYLPEKVKLKYLEYLVKHKNNKVDFKYKCMRCLEMQHSGQCKVTLNTQTIEKAFEFRKCRICLTEVRMGQGKRKISCEKCKHNFCYLCGQDWPKKGKHTCVESHKIKQLENQVYESSFCHCDCCQTYDGCCVCCEFCENQCSGNCPSCDIRCCSNCGECMESCCYCDNWDVSICIGNLVMFFVRILMTFLMMGLYGLMLIPLTMFISMWFVFGVMIGMVMFPLEVISDSDGICKFFAILGCPILAIPGLILGPMELGKSFSGIVSDFCEFFSTGICDMWICLNPAECCR